MIQWLRFLWRGRAPSRTLALLSVGYVPVGGTDTNVASGASNAVQRWAEDVWLELPERVFWAPYMVEDVNAIIQVKKDLEAQPGEKVSYTLARQLSAAAITGDSTLEGNEEAISFYTDSVTVTQNRNAVRLNGRMSEKRTAYSQRLTAKQLLKDWLAARIDTDIFTAIASSPTTVVFGGTAVSTATIAVGDYLTLALISTAKVKARKATPQIYPVNIEGGDYFLLVIAPDCLVDLKTRDPQWAQSQRDAQLRGEDNPLFTGMEGVWDQAVIRTSTRLALATNFGAGGNLTGAVNLFMGRQAGVFAWGMKPEWVEQAYDYGNKTGFAIGAIYAAKKAVFNSVDNGAIAVDVYRSNN